jgi:hypothetical protein
MLYHAGMTRSSGEIVRRIAAGLVLLACACTSTHEHSGAGAGGKTSGGSGGENAAGASSGAGGASASGQDTKCETAADCGYGEIDHEITKRSDCICLFGCPSLPLNKAAIERRKASYAKLCDPNTDGKGQRCPIDDCVPLTAAVCDNHVCRAAPR